jgi:hypothetical protein
MTPVFIQPVTETSVRRSFWGIKRGRLVRLTDDCLDNLRSTISHIPISLHSAHFLDTILHRDPALMLVLFGCPFRVDVWCTADDSEEHSIPYISSYYIFLLAIRIKYIHSLS